MQLLHELLPERPQLLAELLAELLGPVLAELLAELLALPTPRAPDCIFPSSTSISNPLATLAISHSPHPLHLHLHCPSPPPRRNCWGQCWQNCWGGGCWRDAFQCPQCFQNCAQVNAEGSTFCPISLPLSCFPAAAMVTRRSDAGLLEHIPISMATVGDHVLVGYSPGGVPMFEPIYLQGHASAARAPHVRLHLRGGGEISATEDHYLPLASGGYVVFGRASAGMELTTFAPDGTTSLAAVERVERCELDGLYNPHTMGGNIVVNGVLVSCHSAWILEGAAWAEKREAVAPAVYQALLAPVRQLYLAAPKYVKEVCTELVRDGVSLGDKGIGEIVVALWGKLRPQEFPRCGASPPLSAVVAAM